MRFVTAVPAFAACCLALHVAACKPQPSSQERPAVVANQGAPAAPAADTGQRPSSTRSIQCGAQTCVAGESSCVRLQGQEPRCVGKNEADDHARAARDEDMIVACDDGSDCATGERCCAGQYWGGTGPHMHMCSTERCYDAIACIVPTDCPPGLACRMRDSGYGHCEVADPGVQCGAVRCGGATPVCCWNAERNQGRCIAESDSSACQGDAEGQLRCRGRADCGGYSCCWNMLRGTDCRGVCPGASLGDACQTVADCSPEGLGPGGVRQRYDACVDGACTGKLCNASGSWVPCEGL